jgi:hypothetical protein
MGGGGFLGLGPAPQAPAAPDYQAAAQATASGNLDAARAATAANRVNQVTPYGNLDYSITGQDPYGNPTWTANTSLSGVGQQLLNNQNQASLGLGSTINSALGRTQEMMGQGFNPNLPQVGINAGQNYQDAAMQRLAPQLQQSREALNNQLANSGIPVGSEAYNRAQMNQAQKENDLYAANTTQGFNTGLQANQQAFGQEMTKYNMPLNTLSALRSGAQVQNPTFQNAPQQATTSGADVLGASQMGYNAQMGGFNAANAAQSNFNSGLMGLGGTLGAAAIMSDIRTKENIVLLGWSFKGLSVYEYEYKPEWKSEAGHGKYIGVMAQEVEEIMPEAVITRPDGYKMVNYGALNG